MAQATYHFPRGFLWGSATAAHQVEGNNTRNNWWAYEQQPGNILHDHKSGIACDWWNGRWREDFDRAAEAGQNALRLSIEWSRLQPTEKVWDESALDRYLNMVRGLVERNMTPMVTLHHFSDPIWLTERGGWENPEMVTHFEKFVRKVVDGLRDYVNLWVTINEPNVLATNAYVLGDFPPGKSDLRAALQVMTNLARANAVAYQAIHQIQPTARVGLSVQYRSFRPARAWFPLDSWAAGLQSKLFNDFFLRAAQDGIMRFPGWNQRLPYTKPTQDFIGLNYYTRDLVAFSPLKASELFGRRFFPPDAEVSENNWNANVPEGIFEAVEWALKFKLPIIITENGIDDSTDSLRPRYLVQHLHELWKAINFNFPVKGYFHWTLVDNFEWERGWTQRFGLWELDPETQVRRKRPSADLYAAICRQNGISSETVARFAPQLFEKLFPN